MRESEEDGSSRYAILSDIPGHGRLPPGDMDFKVTGAPDGIAIQMDIPRVHGLSRNSKNKHLNRLEVGRRAYIMTC